MTSRAPQRSARREVGEALVLPRPRARRCDRTALGRRPGAHAPDRLHRADVARRSARSRPCPARRPGSARPAPAGPPDRLAGRRRGSQVLVAGVMPPPAAAACRAPRRPRRRRARVRPGQVGQRPGDPQHPVEAADRQRAALQRPLGQPQRPRAGPPSARAAAGPGTWPFSRQPGPGQPLGRGGPGRRAPARRRPRSAPACPSPSSQAARVTGGRSTRRSMRSSSGPDSRDW